MAVRAMSLLCLAIAVNTGADQFDQDKSRDVAAKTEAKQTVSVDDIPPHQVLCMKKKRTGSRVSRNVCKTLAEWKLEISMRSLRPAHMIRAQGKRAGWE